MCLFVWRMWGWQVNPYPRPLHAAFCKHDLEHKLKTNFKLIIDHAPK
jgi:hypothetical protein